MLPKIACGDWSGHLENDPGLSRQDCFGPESPTIPKAEIGIIKNDDGRIGSIVFHLLPVTERSVAHAAIQSHELCHPPDFLRRRFGFVIECRPKRIGMMIPIVTR